MSFQLVRTVCAMLCSPTDRRASLKIRIILAIRNTCKQGNSFSLLLDLIDSQFSVLAKPALWSGDLHDPADVAELGLSLLAASLLRHRAVQRPELVRREQEQREVVRRDSSNVHDVHRPFQESQLAWSARQSGNNPLINPIKSEFLIKSIWKSLYVLSFLTTPMAKQIIYPTAAAGMVNEKKFDITKLGLRAECVEVEREEHAAERKVELEKCLLCSETLSSRISSNSYLVAHHYAKCYYSMDRFHSLYPPHTRNGLPVLDSIAFEYR